MGVGTNIFCASGFEHFSGGVAHVLDHGALVFAVRHVNFEHGNSVDVFHRGIEFDEIIPAREDFAETGNVNAGTRFEKSFFISFTETGSVPVEFHGGFAFVAETTKEFLVRRSVG